MGREGNGAGKGGAVAANPHDEGGGTVSRWLAAGPPYEFTRDELLSALALMGKPMTPTRLQGWANRGLLPPPSRRTVPPGVTDGTVRALYPVWVVALLGALYDRSARSQTVEELRAQLPELREQLQGWAERDGGLDLLMKHRLIALKDGRPIARLPGEDWPVAIATPVAPKVTRALQRAAWQVAEEYTARAWGTPAKAVGIQIFDAEGKRRTAFIPPPPPPRRKRKKGD